MAEKAKKDNKNLIIGICAAVVVVVAIIIAVVFATKGTVKIDDSYFVSDGTKYVLTVEGGYLDSGDEDIAQAVKTPMVYTYSGDTITGATLYQEYTDEATAKSVYDALKAQDPDEVAGVSVNGKYLVAEMPKEEYEDMTASDVKEQIEFMEMFNNMNLDDEDYETDYEDIELIED